MRDAQDYLSAQRSAKNTAQREADRRKEDIGFLVNRSVK